MFLLRYCCCCLTHIRYSYIFILRSLNFRVLLFNLFRLTKFLTEVYELVQAAFEQRFIPAVINNMPAEVHLCALVMVFFALKYSFSVVLFRKVEIKVLDLVVLMMHCFNVESKQSRGDSLLTYIELYFSLRGHCS